MSALQQMLPSVLHSEDLFMSAQIPEMQITTAVSGQSGAF